MVVVIPLALSTSLYRAYNLPKFVLLIVASSALLTLLANRALESAASMSRHFQQLRSRHVKLVCLYVMGAGVSTLFGVAPAESFFGSKYNQMGLVTLLCFLVSFFGLIVGSGFDEARLKLVLGALALAGLAVAIFAVAQFFGLDPFVASTLYTSVSAVGTVIRVTSTLGHADYVGNLLLYTTPLAAGLALSRRGRARILLALTTAVSALAIVCSGTRGSWLGLLVATLAFCALAIPQLSDIRAAVTQRLVRQAAIVSLLMLVSVGLISLVPASRSIAVRARSIAAEGFTGSGRTTLWRDAIRMVPSYAIVGAGPEGFRKAFLPYKSKELVHISPAINNESSHSAYLDAAISFGLLGLVLYAAVIASTIALFLSARRRAAGSRMRIIYTGLVSSFVGAVVHNFFIYDQIPTGLYFFAFAALAQVSSTLAGGQKTSVPPSRNIESAGTQREHIRARLRPVAVSAGLALTVLALWYSINLVKSDLQIKEAFASAEGGDFERVVKHGEAATEGPAPTDTYDFFFGSALVSCNYRMKPVLSSGTDARAQASVRQKALEVGTMHLGKWAARSLTPDLDNQILAYLALFAGDAAKLRAAATEAIKWDSNSYTNHWLLAEALLLEGDREGAVMESSMALDLNPGSLEAASALKRAGGKKPKFTPEQLMSRGVALSIAGKLKKARRVLLRAIRKTKGPLPDGHYALATVYERSNRFADAIAEWEVFMKEAPARAAEEQIAARIQSLRDKSVTKQ